MIDTYLDIINIRDNNVCSLIHVVSNYKAYTLAKRSGLQIK